jgi:hypothetical protein
MLLRRALPATRQSLAHPFPIYEMGSRRVLRLTSELTAADTPDAVGGGEITEARRSE